MKNFLKENWFNILAGLFALIVLIISIFIYNKMFPVRSQYAQKVEELYQRCDKDPNYQMCTDAVTALLNQDKKQCGNDSECMTKLIDSHLISLP